MIFNKVVILSLFSITLSTTAFAKSTLELSRFTSPASQLHLTCKLLAAYEQFDSSALSEKVKKQVLELSNMEAIRAVVSFQNDAPTTLYQFH